MLVCLSIFDLFGSIAYAFTSLPISINDYVEGANGNDASCTAQGFFIQLGTTAAYINVSLAVYYLMVINFTWSEDKLRKYKILFFVFPISIGVAFAFTGIPFYGGLILWCNNDARWWPEIPIIAAIVAATAVMFAVFVHVYKEERASKRWRQAGTARTSSFSRAVFWQSLWYLMSFYVVWPPYLALQYVSISTVIFTHVVLSFLLYLILNFFRNVGNHVCDGFRCGRLGKHIPCIGLC